MCKIKTRLPLTAWVLAALVTLSSVVSTLMDQHRSGQAHQTDLAQATQYDAAGHKSTLAASVH